MGFGEAIKRLFTLRQETTVIRYIEMTSEQIDGMQKSFSMMDEAFKEMDKILSGNHRR